MEPSAETEQIIAGDSAMLNRIKAMNQILILSRSEEGKPKLNARNTIQGYFSDTERIKYNTNGIKSGSPKNIDLLKVKRRYS